MILVLVYFVLVYQGSPIISSYRSSMFDRLDIHNGRTLARNFVVICFFFSFVWRKVKNKHILVSVGEKIDRQLSQMIYSIFEKRFQ